MKFCTPSKLRFLATLTGTTCILSFGSIYPAAAENSRRYTNIEQNEFENCIRNARSDEGWTEYNGENEGKITIKANAFSAWIATVGYRFNPSEKSLDLTIEEKTQLASEGRIWEGFDNTIRNCGGNTP